VLTARADDLDESVRVGEILAEHFNERIKAAFSQGYAFHDACEGIAVSLVFFGPAQVNAHVVAL